MNAASTKVGLAAAIITVSTLACAGWTHGPTRAPAPALADIAVPNNVPLFTDDFSSGGEGWHTQNTSEAAIDHTGGALRFKVWAAQSFAWSSLEGQTYGNVHIDVTVKDSSGDQDHTFGVICGQQGTQDAEYFFAVSPKGAYEIGKRLPDSPIYKILTGYGSWTQTALIPKKAASYRLGADCGPGRLALYVNGKKLDTASDFSYPTGMVGVFVRSGNQSAGPVYFDDFQMSGLLLRGGR